MSRSLNKVLLIGRLGRDPEVRYMQSGQAVANFSVATNEGYKDKNGDWQERTEWHKVVLFGKTAEAAAQYLSKGDQVYIEGRNQTREWENDGTKRFTTEVVGKQMIMLGGKRDGDGGGPSGGDTPPDDDFPF